MDNICHSLKYINIYLEFIAKYDKIKLEVIMDSVVELVNVTKLYGKKVALNNVTLKLETGKNNWFIRP